MAYIKACNKCGTRISMREMPQGQWVAFDVGSDDPHECGVTGRKSNRAYVKKKNTSKFASINQKLDEMHIIDRFGKIYDLNIISNKWLNLTPRNLRKIFNVLIKNQKKAQILYKDRNGNSTNRTIYPLRLIQNNNYGKDTSDTLKIVGYCNLRKDYRTFSLESIEKIQALNKIPKMFRDEFDLLSSSERNQILDGANFYDSNSKYFDREKVYEEKLQKINTQAKTRLRTPHKSTEIPQQQPYSSYSNPQTESSGAWIWWVIGFFLLIWIF